MKIKLVCDCCDSLFREIDIADDAGMTDLEALTGEEFKDIILQNDGSDIFVSATCDECCDELGLEDNNDLVFRSEPIIH